MEEVEQLKGKLGEVEQLKGKLGEAEKNILKEMMSACSPEEQAELAKMIVNKCKIDMLDNASRAALKSNSHALRIGNIMLDLKRDSIGLRAATFEEKISAILVVAITASNDPNEQKALLETAIKVGLEYTEMCSEGLLRKFFENSMPESDPASTAKMFR